MMPAKPRLLRFLFWGSAILISLFVLGAFFLPREVRITRSVMIQAKAGDVFDELQSFKKWDAWAPWFQRDRFIEKKFDGPESGVGAMMAWKSKKEGEGRIKLVAAMPPRSLRLAIDFGENGEADSWFDLKDAGGGATEVTWGFQTDFGQNMARRYFGLLLSRPVTRDLDEGLASLKSLLETRAAAAVPR